MEMRKVDTWLESTREYALRKRRGTHVNTLHVDFLKLDDKTIRRQNRSSCCRTRKTAFKRRRPRAAFMSTVTPTFLTTLNISSTEGAPRRQRLLCCFLFLLVLSGICYSCRALLSPRCWFMTSRDEPTNMCLSWSSNTSCYLSDQWFSFQWVF